MQYVVTVRKSTVGITEQRILDFTNSAFGNGSLTPLCMGFGIIDRNAQNLDIALLEVTDTVIKSD